MVRSCDYEHSIDNERAASFLVLLMRINGRLFCLFFLLFLDQSEACIHDIANRYHKIPPEPSRLTLVRKWDSTRYGYVPEAKTVMNLIFPAQS